MKSTLDSGRGSFPAVILSTKQINFSVSIFFRNKGRLGLAGHASPIRFAKRPESRRRAFFHQPMRESLHAWDMSWQKLTTACSLAKKSATRQTACANAHDTFRGARSVHTSAKSGTRSL